MSIQFASSRGGSPVHRTQSALATSVSIRAMTAACAGAQMTVKHEQRLLPVYATSPETGTVMGAPKEKAPLAMVPLRLHSSYQRQGLVDHALGETATIHQYPR